jgi:hypothetical protein
MKNVKYSVDEGTFYEKVFCPSRIRVLGLEKPQDRKRTWEEARQGNLKLEIADERGATIEVEGTRLVSRVLQYLRPYTKMADAKLSELREVEPSRLEKILNKALKKSKKEIKFLFDDQSNLRGIASTMHEQISWSKVREIIEGAVKEVCGQVEQPKSFGHFDAEHPFKWTYKLPLKNENVSAYVGVHAGNNIIKGRSGIHLWSKFRTEREGSGGAPACLNWCGMWSLPLKWFNIDTQRLNNITSMIGAEKVQTLKMAQFHIKPNMEKFQAEVTDQLAGMVKAVEAIKVVINKSVQSPLSKSEMRAILTAYQNKMNLPNYIIKQILDNVKEETVWAFSNAISWVRTHGDFKQFRICKPVEDRPLTRSLENIAGEVLSLTPTINDFHGKVGEITLDRLVLPKQEQEAVVQATA